MTCIAGFVSDNGDIWMGGDSIGVLGGSYVIVRDPKVFVKGNMIFGFTSSFRMGDILRYDFDIPEHSKSLSTDEYLRSVFLVSLIKQYSERKFLNVGEDSVASGGIFLLGYLKKLYKVEYDFCIIEDMNNYNAVGCGEEYAKGAFCIMEENKKIKPQDRVIKALTVASKFSLVKPPFHIFKLPASQELN
jgi:ATP-dependent protease HslVU (ClpYQ) peptidase subunit